MTVNQLIKALQARSDEGLGDLPVTFDGIGFSGTWVEVEYAAPSTEQVHALRAGRVPSTTLVTRHMELT